MCTSCTCSCMARLCHLDLLCKHAPGRCLFQVHFSDFPESLLQGEMCKVHVHFTNCGSTALSKLRVACTHPEVYSLTSGSGAQQQQPNDQSETTYHSQHCSHSYITKPHVRFVEAISLDNDCLQPGESQTVVMWLCAPSGTAGFDGAGLTSGSSMSVYKLSRVTDAHLLFYYEPLTRQPRSRMQ